jgi:hypothetical protein
VIYLPAFVRFHSTDGKKLDGAVLKNVEKGIINFEGKSTTNWLASCKKAFDFCAHKVPATLRYDTLWSLNINGEDVFLNEIRKDFFVSKDTYSLTDTTEKMTLHEAVHVTHHKKIVLKMKNRMNMNELFEVTDEIANKRNVKIKKECFLEDDDEEDDFAWTPLDDEWTTSSLEEYALRFPDKAPTLIRINSNFKTTTTSEKFCNSIYECVFEHPISKVEKKVNISSTVLYNVPSYRTALKLYK